MYTVRKVALLALTLSSPALAGLLPPPVECVDGKPVGVNLPVATLPDPFTIQAISTGDDPGSLPLVLGEQLGTSDSTRLRMGATSKNPGLSFNLTDNQVYYTEDLFLTSVKSNGYGNTLDLGIGPGFPSAGLQFNAEYVCRSDDTPVLVLQTTGNEFLGSTGGSECSILHSDKSAPSKKQRNS